MKQIYAMLIISISLASTPLYALAQRSAVTLEQMRGIVRAAKVVDEPNPLGFEKVTIAYREFFITTKKLFELKQAAYKSIIDAPTLPVTSKNDALKIAQAFDSTILSLNKQRDTYLSQIKKIEENKDFAAVNALMDTEYNFLDYDTYKNYSNDEYTALITALATTRDYYRSLAQLTTKYAAINGQIIFESPSAQYEYWKYIVTVRDALKRSVNAELSTIEQFLKNSPKVEEIYGAEYAAALKKVAETDKAMITLWSQQVPAQQPQEVKDSSFTLEVDDELTRRLKQDQKLTDISARIKALSTEYNAVATYKKERFATKQTIKRALDVSKQMLTLYKELDTARFVVVSGFHKEFPYSYNILRDAIGSSDQVMKYAWIDIQYKAAENEGIEYDIKMYTLALNNFGKFKNYFGDDTKPYKLVFTKNAANVEFIKIHEGYNTRLKEYLLYEAEQQQKQDELKQQASPNS
jgi:hypothetical protein